MALKLNYSAVDSSRATRKFIHFSPFGLEGGRVTSVIKNARKSERTRRVYKYTSFVYFCTLQSEIYLIYRNAALRLPRVQISQL